MLINPFYGRRELSENFRKEIIARGQEMLRVEHLHAAGQLTSISFRVLRGLIPGIAGLIGAGRTELVRAIFRADLIDSGQIYKANALTTDTRFTNAAKERTWYSAILTIWLLKRPARINL